MNEAALLAARKGKRVVFMNEFEEAKDKVMMGSERRSMVMTDEEKKLTAYHEAGHAVVALHCPDSILFTKRRSYQEEELLVWL